MSMFVTSFANDRLSPAGRRVFDLAEAEAKARKRHYVGVEHVVVALLQEGGVVSDVLSEIGLTIDAARDRTKRYTDADPEVARTANPVYTPRAFALATQLANVEADNLGHQEVGPAHILLAACAQSTSLGAKVLYDELGSLDAIREKVLAVLAS